MTLTQKSNVTRGVDYANSKFEDTKKYIASEIAVMENVSDYETFYKFMEQFPERIKTVVLKEAPNKEELEHWDNDVKERLTVGRDLYLRLVSEELEKRSDNYSPMQGSAWEAFSECLKEAGKYIKASI